MPLDPAGVVNVDAADLAARLSLVEARLADLEEWRRRGEAGEAGPALRRESVTPRTDVPEQPAEIGFDLALIGRTLIVLGGAYLLRAVTESQAIPVAAGVGLGLLYAVAWSIAALRMRVSRASAAHHGVATVLTALPIILEATTKFKVLHAWSAALALAGLSAVVLILVARRRLHGVAWTFALMAIALSPVLMDLTESMVPFVLYLTALGIATVWLAYVFEWRLLRWVVAAAADIALFTLCLLVATNRLPGVTPATAIAVSCAAIAAYLATFAIRTLLRQRDVVPFEIAQTISLLLMVLGGAMWVAASRATLEVPLAIAMLVLAAGSYAVSFAFIPRRFATPANFVFYSSLGLMLIVTGGALLTRGLANSILWSTLAIASGFLAMRYRKSSLALHAGVFLISGLVGADLLRIGVHSLFLKVEGPLPLPSTGALLLFIACGIAAAIRPIERQGSFELWTTAKVIILGELGWAGATLLLSAFAGALPDAAVLAVIRTSVLGGLTVLTAWASRYPTLSPGRFLTTPLLVVLAMKLVWEDIRVGRPATLFISFAIVGIVLILTQRFRRRAFPPQPTTVAA